MWHRHIQGRNSLTVALVGILAGCGVTAPYKVTAEDKFTAPEAPLYRALTDNSIDYHDPLQAFRTSQLNAYVERDRKSDAVLSAGFEFVNQNEGGPIVASGQDLVFLADDRRIVAHCGPSIREYKYDRQGINDYVEAVSCKLDDPRSMGVISKAAKLEFKVNGQRGALTYPRTNFQLLPSFRKNIDSFFSTEVAPHI